MPDVDPAVVGVLRGAGPAAPRLDLERVRAQEPRHGPRSHPLGQGRQPGVAKGRSLLLYFLKLVILINLI